MCGIAGIVTSHPRRHLATIEAMSAMLAHRGPDDAGTWSDERAMLVHRRLSIIDTSTAGHQPMTSHCGRYVMSYNGEIYNYLELRRDLEHRGVLFRSQSDSEVLLAAFVAYGVEFLTMLNGMWAFAIWDRKAARLMVSRDRFGEKPFYYFVRDGSLVFASEIKALLATGWVEREPEPAMVADFCAERVSDHTERTFFKGISQLAPGTWGWWEDGVLSPKRYWRLPDDDHESNRGDLVEEIAALLGDSVRIRLRADTPVGTLLSGGLDSSGVTCLAAERVSGRLTAFSTVNRPPPEEAAGIELVLQAHGNVELRRDEPGSETLDDELTNCLWHQEEPFADGSMLAHFRLMRLARQSGIRVLLTGQGADEIFAGYPGYLAVHLGGLIRRGQWRMAAALWRSLVTSGQRLQLASIGGYALPKTISSEIRRRRKTASVDWIADGYRRVTPEIGEGYATNGGDALNEALRASLTCRTLPGFLHYEDRNSMAFGVETRIPYLDHRLVSKVLPTPGSSKLAGGRPKSLLRSALAGKVPEPIVRRLAKQGYPAPLGGWLRAEASDRRVARLEAVRECPLIDFGAWLRRHRRFQEGNDGELPAVWRGLIVALWHARFMRQIA
ncbi:MAG: asparagine synthase (glutamine-hydrolyzing) [Burkholderiales bacterium]|nr:asparagine synthase (glutamine-hydrolyzing) [Burkholderiales bacterium]